MANRKREGEAKKPPKQLKSRTITTSPQVNSKLVDIKWVVALEEGANAIGGGEVEFFANENSDGRETTKDSNGWAVHTFTGVDPSQIAGRLEILACLVGTNVSCHEEVDLEPFRRRRGADEPETLDIESTGKPYVDCLGHAHIPWTPRLFNEAGQAIGGILIVRGPAGRSFTIRELPRKLNVAVRADTTGEVHEIVLNADTTATFEIIVPTEGTLEIDVIVDRWNLKEQLTVSGAKFPAKVPGANASQEDWERDYFNR